MNSRNLKPDQLREYQNNLSTDIAGYEFELERIGADVPKYPESLKGTEGQHRTDLLEAHLCVLRTEASYQGLKVSEHAQARLKVTLGGISESASEAGAATKTSESRRATSQQGGEKSGSGEKKTATQDLLDHCRCANLQELKAYTAKRYWTAQAKRVGRKVSAILFATLCLNVSAQDPRAYTLLSGGTNKVTALSSNATLYLNVSEFTDLAFQFSASSLSGANSNILLHVYRTVDSDVPETAPFTTLTHQLSGATTNTSFFPLDIGNAASLRVVVANTNSGGFASNLVLKARFKAAKKKIAS